MLAISNRWVGFSRIGLLLLIVGTFCLDFTHGIWLGQDQVIFSPIYRLRQTLAVAVSRLHDPSPGGYLAYRSVVNVFNDNGFAIFEEERGLHLDRNGWIALFNDGPRLNRILQEASDVAINSALPPDIIAGNEPGYADYIYLSFLLFGLKVSSMYYLYFSILGVSALVYVLNFRRSPFPLFLLAVYLAELYFLENYAQVGGFELNTITNSRLFSALSLLPAAHILFAVWQSRPARPSLIAAVVVQAAILAFLVSCRIDVSWQVAMIFTIAALIAAARWWRRRGLGFPLAIDPWKRLWPAGILLVLVLGNTLYLRWTTDERYLTEPKTHIIWHEVLMGILSSSLELSRRYVGYVDRYTDTMVYEAVIRDLNARNDTTSPVTRIENGRITFDTSLGWGGYDDLVRSLSLRIIRDHPFRVIAGLLQKARDQITFYEGDHPNKTLRRIFWSEKSAHNAFTTPNLAVTLVVIAVGAAICAVGGGYNFNGHDVKAGLAIGSIVVLFAAVTPAIKPSSLAVGPLFCYMTVPAVLIAWLIKAVVVASENSIRLTRGQQRIRT